VGALQYRPCHVLLFSSFGQLGWGGQESLFQLVSRLDRDHFRPSVVVPSVGSLAHSLSACGIDVHVLNLPKVAPGQLGQVMAALRRLSALVDEEGVDLLHTDGPRNTFYAGVVGRLKRRPVVWHVRSSTADRYDRLLSLLCSKIILVANCLTRRFQFPRQSQNLITIHNGVDVNHFAPGSARQVSIQGFRFRPDDIIITVSARVERQKGQRYLIEACSQLRHLLPRLHILCAGDIVEQAYYQSCIQRACELGVIDNVHFLGHVENIRQLLQDTDIFVLPSIKGEAFPRSVLEAMSSGIPVVATDCGGTREAVENDVCGFLVQPQDSTEMARRIAILSEDSALRSRMGRAGRKIAVERFGIERNVARTVEVYREIIQAKGLANAFAIQ
jgi:glycosyltransferase involved in cell wall biosynthesis